VTASWGTGARRGRRRPRAGRRSSPSPSPWGVRARVIGGDLKLGLTFSAGHEVVVLELEGEPHLRLA